MANPQVPELAQLKDIYLPDAVGWWPLAPGWYLLMFLCLAVVFSTVFFLWRRYVSIRSKKQALHLLHSYKSQYDRDRNSQLASARVSELLKRVALVYFPRVKVASLQGDQWVKFLDDTAEEVDFIRVRYELLELPYAPPGRVSPAEANMKALFHAAHQWIKQRSKPCLN